MEPIKVALHGFDQRSADRLKNIFRINFRGKCLIASPEEAVFRLVDLEGLSDDPRELLGSLNPEHALLLSDQQEGPKGFMTIAKPARLDLLWKAISGSSSITPLSTSAPSESDSARAIQQHVVESATPRRSATLRKLGQESRYQPDDYFVGYLLQLLSDRPACRAIKVITWSQQQIIICLDRNRIYTDISSSQFRNLTATRLAKNLRMKAVCQYLADLPCQEERKELRALSVNELLWWLSYTTSRGRLPESLDLAQKHYLSRWPNFTRLPMTPNGMRIAAVWAGEPQYLDDIAMRLGIDKEEVYAFYAAASALGLSGVARRQSDLVVETNSKGSRSRFAKGGLGAVLGHISSLLSSDKKTWTAERQA